MKILGYILLSIGVLSLIGGIVGGIVSPSYADTSVVIFGYVLKISLILGGILLISRKKQYKNNDSGLHEHRNQQNLISASINNDLELEVQDKLKTENERYNQILKEIYSQESELFKLKSQNLLTEEEYIDKLKIIDNKKVNTISELDKIKLVQEKDRIQLLVNNLIKPKVIFLENALKSGILTQEEFEKKSKFLHNEMSNTIYMVPYLNPGLNLNMDVLKEKDLSRFHRDYIARNLPSFIIGDNVIYNKRTKKLHKYSSTEFMQLNRSEEAGSYAYIEIPNFLQNIGYPQLNKKFENRSISVD